jgi:RHS repeat-associated protein
MNQNKVYSTTHAKRIDSVSVFCEYKKLTREESLLIDAIILRYYYLTMILSYYRSIINDSPPCSLIPIPYSLKKRTPPWILLGNGVTSETLGVQQQGYVPGASSASATSGNVPNPQLPFPISLPNGVVPVQGMYFLHPDHLGSITMITDGNGNVVSGGTFGGKSNIIYKPYGEIDRANSTGPDISRYKFTGQEEDKEVGLMYYKARYYDPMLGRFTSADSIVSKDDIFGMNRYMYVNGNPTKFRDPDGHKVGRHFAGAVFGYLIAPQMGLTREQGAFLGHSFMNDDVRRNVSYAMRQIRRDGAEFFRDMRRDGADYFRMKIRGFNREVHKLFNGGRNRENNDFDRTFGGSLVEDLWEGDFGRSDYGRMMKNGVSYFGNLMRNPQETVADSDAMKLTECAAPPLALTAAAYFGGPLVAKWLAPKFPETTAFLKGELGKSLINGYVILSAIKDVYDVYTCYQRKRN